jgi:uncharacterized protein YjdB
MRLLSLASLALVLTSCSDGAAPIHTEPGVFFAKAPFVTVTPDAATLTFGGETIQLTATTKNGKPVSWSSGAVGVAAVNSTGLVTAISEGNALITASFGGHSASASITVDFP